MLSGYINSQKSIFWGTATLNKVVERSLHSIKCTVWVAMSTNGIITSVWFEDQNKELLTVAKEQYIVVLQQYWTTLGC